MWCDLKTNKIEKGGIFFYRLLKGKSTEIKVKAADKTFVLGSCSTYGCDFKVVLHKAECMCDQPNKLDIEEKSLYQNSVSYLTEPEANSTKDEQCSLSVKCEPPQEEEELYIDMLPSA